ncbi:MAG: sigma-70 family RNA polymerase sigma factor [Planctomycetia bacterium]|nr:sigma-70 family RNA polymerase sigma factor [Planctomycetia bacterium]
MAPGHLTTVMRHLRRLLGDASEPAASDGRLLERFIDSRDEDAFAQLVQRHGPLVLGVCRRVLRDLHAAEDAFQGTFLILARKAHSVRRHASLAGWLGRVAFRVALDARAAGIRRAARERTVAAMTSTETAAETDRSQVRLILEEELQALPRKYYEPLVLCYLESRTHEEAARLLHWPEGTVKGRMARGREMLRDRLVRRGLTLGGGALAALLAEEASAASVSPTLAAETLRAVLGSASASVAALVEGVLHSWQLTRWKWLTALACCTCAAVGLSVGLVHSHFTAAGPEGGSSPPPVAQRAAEPAVDVHGDLLPPNALARLGTARYRAGAAVDGLVLSPDGKFLVSAGSGGLRLWDAHQGKLLHHLGDSAQQRAVFTADGNLTAAMPGQVRSWSARGDQELRNFDLKGAGAKQAVAFVLTPDGKRFAGRSGGQNTDQTLHVWDGATGQELSSWQAAPSVSCLALSPDGGLLAAAEGPFNTDQTVRLWNATTGRLVRSLPAINQDIRHLTFSPDGRWLISAGQLDLARRDKDKPPRSAAVLWDVEQGAEVARFVGRQAASSPVAFAPDGQTLALGDYETIRLWDVARRQETRNLLGHQSSVSALCFTGDGKLLLSADQDGLWRQWDVATGKETRTAYGHRTAVGPIVWTPDGDSLITCADDSVRFWDARTGKFRRQVGPVARDYFTDHVFSPDLKFLLAVQPSRLQVWDLAQGKLLREAKIEPEIWSRNVAISPDGRQFALGENWRAGVWDIATGKRIHEFKTQPVPGPGWCSAYAPDGKLLATSEPGGSFYLWDLPTGQRLHHLHVPVGPAADDYADISCLAFSPDGTELAVVNRRGSLTFWDPVGGAQLRRIKIGASPRDVDLHWLQYAADGRTFAVGNGRTVQWWEVATGQLIREFDGHQGQVGRLAFAPHGKTLASGNQDTTVLVWDLYRPTAEEQLRAERLDETKLTALGTELGQVEAASGYGAVRTLLANPRVGLAYLRQSLQPIAGPTPERLARLVADLSAEQFASRQQAEQALEALAELAEPTLKQTLAGQPPLEVRQRVERLLARLPQQAVTNAETLRGLRAVDVLERAERPEAKAILQRLARGAPGSRVTQEAHRALNRLAKQSAAGKIAE